MFRLGSVLVAGALAAGLTTSPVSAAPADHTALRQAMAELVRSGASGVTVRTHDERGDWAGSAGTRDRNGGTVPTDGRFRAGSITKMFVSTVVLQLVGEGRVALDDPVHQYLPSYGLDRRITVRMLLQHTSGLFNYTGEFTQDGAIVPGIPLSGKEYIDNRFRTYQPDELVAISLAKPANFAPGTGWSYSNTNYILAAQLIERLTGTPYAFQVQQRVLRPLGLRDTVFPGSWPGVPGQHAHGYLAYLHNGRSKVADVTHINPTMAWAAGEVISTTRDLDRFITALLGGDLLRPDLLAQMRDPFPLGPGGGYGLGLLSLNLGPECGGVYEGHDGGLPGFVSLLLSTGDGERRLEVSVTVGAVNPDDQQAVERFSAALSTLVGAAVCGVPRPARDITLLGGPPLAA